MKLARQAELLAMDGMDVISLFHLAFLTVPITRNFGNANANLREIWTCFDRCIASSGYHRGI